MKTNLIGLAVAAISLTSFAAFADDWDDDDDNNGVEVSVGWNQNVPCDHDHEAVPVLINQAPPPRADGRYEQRTTQRWIPARYEQVTVQQCVEHHNHHGGWKRNQIETQCFPVTQTRLVPGYYQPVSEWVFVPYPPPPQQYSQYPGHRPPLFGQVGFTFGTR